jgi:hypothetical protein
LRHKLINLRLLRLLRKIQVVRRHMLLDNRLHLDLGKEGLDKVLDNLLLLDQDNQHLVKVVLDKAEVCLRLVVDVLASLRLDRVVDSLNQRLDKVLDLDRVALAKPKAKVVLDSNKLNLHLEAEVVLEILLEILPLVSKTPMSASKCLLTLRPKFSFSEFRG